MNINIIERDLEFIINSPVCWDLFKNTTILVTGANGFLPAYMIETLFYLNQKNGLNTRIIGLARNREKTLRRFESHATRTDLEIIIQDVCSPLKIDGNIDYIIHAASQASPKYYGKDPVGTALPNIIGTNNLLQLACEKKVRSFLFFSSGEVYGEIGDDNTPVDELHFGYIDPTNVRSCYSESKRMGETLCACYYSQFKVPVKIVRPFHTYGPGMSLNDGRVFADFVSDVVSNRNIIMKSDGLNRRAFCYLADATVAFFMALLNGTNGEAYNVGNPESEISIIDLAKLLTEIFPEKQLKVVRIDNSNTNGYIQSKVTKIIPDISKLSQLGWKPSFSIQQGFLNTINYYL